MVRDLSRGAAWALALFLAGASLPAQELPEPVEAPIPLPQDSIQEALAQFQTLDARVNEIQEQAMEAHPELQDEQSELQAAIEAAMFAAYPELQTALQERLPAMQEEAAAAQAAQDTAQLQALNDEYQGIMMRVEQAQADVVDEEGMRARLTTFQDRVMAAMVQVDPDIEEVFERLRTLAGRLDATLGG
jgi:DNA repair exonuclease SbcCD ATPase subunit